jgi:hypothetical protein
MRFPNPLCLPPLHHKRARAGWAEAFQKMAQRGDDTLLDEVVPSLSTWDDDEWQWQ